MRVKNLLLLLPLSLLLAAAPANKTFVDERPGIVDFSCWLHKGKEKLKNYVIGVYRDDGFTDSIVVITPKTQTYSLRYNHMYTIVHKAAGYRDRIILVNTFVEDKISINNSAFDYDLEMLRTDESPNTLADLPVALIKWDKLAGEFLASPKYSASVK